MKNLLLSIILLTSTGTLAEEIDVYELTLEETIKRDIAKDFNTDIKVNFEEKDFKDVKDMEKFEKELNRTFKELEDFDMKENVAEFNEKTLKEMEGFKICSQEIMIVYKNNPLNGKCEKVILKNGCEIDSYMKKEHYAAKLENCLPTLD